MPALCSFDYAVVRVVPRPEREEFVNVGVILYCRERRFLGSRLAVDETSLRGLCGEVDLEQVKEHLGLIAAYAPAAPTPVSSGS